MAKSLRILVVVDDRDVAEGLSEVLELAGHDVALALNAERAKSLLAENTYDIGFFNTREAGKGAVETYIGLRRRQPSLEAIMMTGSTTEQLLSEIVVEGKASTLHLPLDFSSLEKSLDYAMPRGIVLLPSNGGQLSDNLCAHLREQGRDAAVARSEPEALELIGRRPNHTIILDLQISVVSALSVYLKLMESGYGQPLIIVGRPPIAGTDTSVPFRDLWVTGVLFKPFDPRKLLAALEQTLPAPAPEGQEIPAEVESPEPAGDEPAGDGPDQASPSGASAPAPAVFAVPKTLLQPPAADEPEGPEELGDEPTFDEPEETGDSAGSEEAAQSDQPEETGELEAGEGPEEAEEPESAGQAEEAEAASSAEEEPDQPRAAEPEAPGSEPTSYSGEGRVLIVDDDHEMAEGIRELLESRGYETAVAYAFDEAVERLRDFAAEVALIDVQIGGSSGLDLIAVLQAEQPMLVPVMLTARADKDTIVAALRSGAYDYLTKPLDPEELFTALDRSFSRLKSTGAGAEELLAKISYGMRTPLNAVVGFSEILKNELLGPIGSEKYVGYAEDINTAGREISGMLGSMLKPSESYGPDLPSDGNPEEEIPFDLDAKAAPAAAEEEVEKTDGGQTAGQAAGEDRPPQPRRFEVPSLDDIRSDGSGRPACQGADKQAV